jgi:tRNA A-37 threonylcarbamoyl transferase component Bud32
MTSRPTEPATGAGASPILATSEPSTVPLDSEATVTLSIATAIAAGRNATATSGPTVPRYRPIRPHARDGMGQISVAHDVELDRPVALKEIRVEHADHPAARYRFVFEAEITGKLEHPGVVPVYGMGFNADGRPYYAMRLVHGETLMDAIKRFHGDAAAVDLSRHSLAFRDLLGRFVDVCNAIGYAHSRGVIHRDLKPQNVMLGPFGETLVIDWGLAKTVEGEVVERLPFRGADGDLDAGSGTLLGSAVGTPGYMSPEQACGELERLGPASDIFSLGATLCTILTGEPPFERDTIQAVIDRTRRAEFRTPRSRNARVPHALDAICCKALALRPEDRYASATELADDVKRWLGDEPVLAAREPLLQRIGRWLRRHRLAASVAVACGLTALACGVASLVLLQRSHWETERQKQIARDYEASAETMVGLLEELTNDAGRLAQVQVQQAPLVAAAGLEPQLERQAVPGPPQTSARALDQPSGRGDAPALEAKSEPMPPAPAAEFPIAGEKSLPARDRTDVEAPLQQRFHRVIEQMTATGRQEAADRVRTMVRAYDARIKQQLQYRLSTSVPPAMIGD